VASVSSPRLPSSVNKPLIGLIEKQKDINLPFLVNPTTVIIQVRLNDVIKLSLPLLRRMRTGPTTYQDESNGWGWGQHLDSCRHANLPQTEEEPRQA